LSRNISSIHVYGRARVILYEGRNFQGNSIDFNNDVVDLVRVRLSGLQTWNDRAGSLRVVSDNGYYSGGPLNSGPDYRRGRQYTQTGICVYENPNYNGRSECFDAGQSDTNLRNTGWGDRISSIRVFGNARAFLFTNAGFGGARMVIDRDVPDLRQF